MDDPTPPGVKKALQALRLPKRKPTDADRPPPSTFPGRKAKVLPGQLDFEGHEAPGVVKGFGASEELLEDALPDEVES
jgi:hypothetical protein